MSPKEDLYNKTIFQSVFFLIFIIAFFFFLLDCLLVVPFKQGFQLSSVSVSDSQHSLKNPDSYKVSFPVNDFHSLLPWPEG